jgi:hypothetical protein
MKIKEERMTMEDRGLRWRTGDEDEGRKDYDGGRDNEDEQRKEWRLRKRGRKWSKRD